MIPPLSSDCLAACVWKCWNGLYFSTKKASVPLKGQKLNIILKYSKTSAVPPNLSIHDHSLMYYHTHLLDNGREIPSASTPVNRFQTALTSPFGKNSYCCNPTTCSSLEINILTYSSCSSVLLLYHSIVMIFYFVNTFFISFLFSYHFGQINISEYRLPTN